jgi:hypothetical protein
VDLDWYANRAGELEFDLTLAPGVDPAGIRLSYTGAERLVVDGSGALVLHTGASQLRQPHRSSTSRSTASGGRCGAATCSTAATGSASP